MNIIDTKENLERIE